MRNSLLASAAVAIYCVSIATAQLSCTKSDEPSPLWVIYSDPDVNIPDGLCERLWGMLESYKDCEIVEAGCGMGRDGDFSWAFYSSATCSSDIVENTWAEVTGNIFGAIDCFWASSTV